MTNAVFDGKDWLVPPVLFPILLAVLFVACVLRTAE
jgi:hypothetical protein